MAGHQPASRLLLNAAPEESSALPVGPRSCDCPCGRPRHSPTLCQPHQSGQEKAAGDRTREWQTRKQGQEERQTTVRSHSGRRGRREANTQSHRYLLQKCGSRLSLCRCDPLHPVRGLHTDDLRKGDKAVTADKGGLATTQRDAPAPPAPPSPLCARPRVPKREQGCRGLSPDGRAPSGCCPGSQLLPFTRKNTTAVFNHHLFLKNLYVCVYRCVYTCVSIHVHLRVHTHVCETIFLFRFTNKT